MSNKQCYWCEDLATTKEHVPPQCFFPKRKHCDGSVADYRSNLITVPACSKHNNSRSKDDEYTAAIVAMNSRSDIAFSILKSKWIGALSRGEASLGKRIFFTAKDVQIISREGDLLIPRKTLAISYEIERINCVIESIARALYYYESGYQEKWTKNCTVRSPNFLMDDLSKSKDAFEVEQIVQFFSHGEKFQELNIPKKGSHQEVFYYQLLKTKYGYSVIKMVFYGDFIFIVILGEATVNSSRVLII
ncbi:MAG TPA: hypothetical protein V6D18_12785 [Thermosynechococcaceae cyanobacterium]